MSTSINRIKEIVEVNQLKNEKFTHFVLQGGAGSGKTESLKEVISFISEKFPEKKIACITHTNVAANEISSRVNNDKYCISTIHSFLNGLIKNYKKNIQDVLPVVFYLDNSEVLEHSDYKKRYEKLAKKKYELENIILDKVVGKKEYDKDFQSYNDALIKDIDAINLIIGEKIKSGDSRNIRYNDTKFDSLKELSFSHNSLLLISAKLCEEFELFAKIISDKFDYIFIDEYQDTNPEIVKLFLELLPSNKNTTIGLFGDSMQGIYTDGIGDVEFYIKKGLLEKIEKDDNFRCSEQVINFINGLRNDNIEQKVALKNGEIIEQRQGEVKLFVKVHDCKPNSHSPQEDKDAYINALKNAAIEIRETLALENLKTLLLTNKSIAKELGFEVLYKIFDDRYTDVKDEIEKELERIQISDIVLQIKMFNEGKHNELLIECKKNGYLIKSLDDKNKLIEILTYLSNAELSLKDALLYSLENGIIKESERACNYKKNKLFFLREFEENLTYKEFEKYWLLGFNTLNRVNKETGKDYNQQTFDDFQHALKKKLFYQRLFSDELKLKEIAKYFDYLNEDAEYITMHKTKGSGIKNVLVILDEYLWSKYDFGSVYAKSDKSIFNQKLFYVSCSRTIKNLAILRFVESESELKILENYFKNCEVKKL